MKNRIRELRERARLSQGELAKLMEVDEASISRWEVGKRPLSPATIEHLAKIFKVSSWEVLLDRKALRRLARHRSTTADAKATGGDTEKGHDAF